MLIIRDYTVAEFRGNFPQIATSESVQLDALTKGDDDPFYVTLPVAVVGATSGNGLHYDEALVKAIQQQMVGRGGLMGHIDDDDRDTAFPIEAADWIGALRQGATLWGKAYVPPGEAREYIRRLKARGGQLATSIYGPYAKKETQSDGSWRAEGFRLETLDLAPADRAALKLGGEFNVTSQMDDNSQEDQEMDKERILAELTVGEIPATLRDQIIADYKTDADSEKQLAELTAERDAEKARVSELEATIAEQASERFDAALTDLVAETVDWSVDGEEAKARVDIVRGALKMAVLAEMGDDKDADKLKKAVKDAWESDSVKLLAETVKAALGGPRAVIGGGTRTSGQLVDTPDTRREARRKSGF